MKLHGGELIWYVHKKYKIPLEKILSFANLTSPIHPELPKPPEFILKSYPDRECEDIKELIAERCQVKKSNIFLTNGSTELIYIVAKIFGKTVQMKVPTYSEYECAVRNYGGKIVFTKDYSPKNVSLSFICNPNNPTGELIKKDNMEKLINGFSSDTKIFIDEAYMGFVSPDKYYSMATFVDNKNLIVSQTLSKFYGMPSLRLSWGIASKELIDKLKKHRYPMSLCGITVFYAKQFLHDKDYKKKVIHLIEKEKKSFIKKLNDINWLRVLPSDVNYFLVEILGDLTSIELFNILAKKGIIVRDCSNIRGLNNKYFRVAVKNENENDLLIKELKKISI